MTADDDYFAAQMAALGFAPPAQQGDLPGRQAPSREALEAADRTSRFWSSQHDGELPLGSDAHRRETCRMFHETFNPYRPSVIDWPKLSPDMLKRITSLPIWDIAVQTEGKARLRFATYAQTLADPEMRAAILLNAWEENRHKEVLSKLVQAYGIPLAVEPAYQKPRDPEWSYLVTGFCECIDSFFAFGLFELARRSGFFPAELVETFEPVVQEECRHILLFANWLAWRRANLPLWQRPFFELRIAAVWAVIAWERLVLARQMNKGDMATEQDSNFTLSSAQSVASVDIGALDLLKICLSENDRRFAGYDFRLTRPTTVPALARLALFLAKPFRAKFWSRTTSLKATAPAPSVPELRPEPQDR